MPPQPSSPHSTPLENLSIDPDGAKFDLAGRTVQLHAAQHAPSVAALQAFYYQAVADYHVRASAPRPGLLSRLWTWAARLLGGPAGSADATPHPLPPAPPPAALAPSRGKPEAARNPAPATPAPQPEAPVTRHPPAHPVLRSAFADKDGLHLVWQPAEGKPGPRKLELTYPLDSGLARRLEECYGQLSQLGYKVVGLEIVRPEREAGPVAKTASPPAKSARVPEPAAAPPAPEKPALTPTASPEAAGSGPKPPAAEPAKPRREKSQVLLKISAARPDEPAARLPEPPAPALPEP